MFFICCFKNKNTVLKHFNVFLCSALQILQSSLMVNSVNNLSVKKGEGNQTWEKKAKKDDVWLWFVTLKGYYTTSDMLSGAPAFPFRTSGHCDEQQAHLLWPVLQLVCEYDVVCRCHFQVRI